MGPAAIVGLLFLALAAVFLIAAVRHGIRPEDGRSPAGKTWLRIAVIFGLVGVGLQLVQRFAR